MTLPEIGTALADAASRRRLLDHPYYQRWQAGTLDVGDLATYASQYRHIERGLPALLEATAEQLDHGPVRQLVERNLDDERSRPRPHVELFDAFAAAVDARDEPATPATQHLVEVYERAAHAGPVVALSTIGAYEIQAADIARTKSVALRAHYGLSPAGTEFWDVHAQLEDDHATWTADALGLLGASPSAVHGHASESAQAWWAFLDEQAAAAS